MQARLHAVDVVILRADDRRDTRDGRVHQQRGVVRDEDVGGAEQLEGVGHQVGPGLDDAAGRGLVPWRVVTAEGDAGGAVQGRGEVVGQGAAPVATTVVRRAVGGSDEDQTEVWCHAEALAHGGTGCCVPVQVGVPRVGRPDDGRGTSAHGGARRLVVERRRRREDVPPPSSTLRAPQPGGGATAQLASQPLDGHPVPQLHDGRAAVDGQHVPVRGHDQPGGGGCPVVRAAAERDVREVGPGRRGPAVRAAGPDQRDGGVQLLDAPGERQGRVAGRRPVVGLQHDSPAAAPHP